MIVFLIVLAVLFLISIIKLKALVEYSDSGFSVVTSVLFFKMKFPRNKNEKEKETPEEQAEKEKRPGKFGEFRDLITPVLKALGKLTKMLRIGDLVADVKVSGNDAFQTAMLFGGASAAFGMLFPFLDKNIKIKKKSISVSADFEAGESTIYFKTDISIRVWQVIYLAVYVLYQYMKKKKGTENYG